MTIFDHNILRLDAVSNPEKWLLQLKGVPPLIVPSFQKKVILDLGENSVMDNPSISISPPPNITIFNILIHLPINTLVFKGSDKLQKKAETSITELPSACLSPKKINSSINHLFPNVVLFTAHAMNLYPMFAFFFHLIHWRKKTSFFHILKVLIDEKKNKSWPSKWWK